MKFPRQWNRAGLLAVLMVASWSRVAASAPTLADELSLVVSSPPMGAGNAFAIFLSGDGGWAELDREVAQRLAAHGLPVVGWNSRAYYWARKTPAAAADALGRIIEHFRTEWKRPRVVLIGYSRGADVLPFLVNRLAAGQREPVALVALLGPGTKIDFEFHLTDWLHEPDAKTAVPVVPEIEALLAGGGPPLLVVYGDEDHLSSGPALAARLPRVVAVSGDHHFARDFDRLAALILAEAGLTKPAG